MSCYDDHRNSRSLLVSPRSLYRWSDTDRDCFNSRSPQLSTTITHVPTSPRFSNACRNPRKPQGYTQYGPAHSRNIETGNVFTVSREYQAIIDLSQARRDQSVEDQVTHYSSAADNKRDTQSIPTQTLHGSKGTPFTLPLSVGVRRYLHQLPLWCFS
jgi:hypothetical protein